MPAVARWRFRRRFAVLAALTLLPALPGVFRRARRLFAGGLGPGFKGPLTLAARAVSRPGAGTLNALQSGPPQQADASGATATFPGSAASGNRKPPWFNLAIAGLGSAPLFTGTSSVACSTTRSSPPRGSGPGAVRRPASATHTCRASCGIRKD
jgi:hypothetical protein